ncbi:EF-hand domain-containing protein [Sergentomyia squamirostris]
MSMWSGFERCSVTRHQQQHQENLSQQETLADVEHISTIAGSLGSIGTLSQCADEPVYDTDHTDLNSDYDEAELRRELLKDKWRQLFDTIDPEGFGEIPVDDFINALKTPEIQSLVPLNKRELLLERARKAKGPKGSGSVSFQEFVNVGNNGIANKSMFVVPLRQS